MWHETDAPICAGAFFWNESERPYPVPAFSVQKHFACSLQGARSVIVPSIILLATAVKRERIATPNMRKLLIPRRLFFVSQLLLTLLGVWLPPGGRKLCCVMCGSLSGDTSDFKSIPQKIYDVLG